MFITILLVTNVHHNPASHQSSSRLSLSPSQLSSLVKTRSEFVLLIGQQHCMKYNSVHIVSSSIFLMKKQQQQKQKQKREEKI